MMEEEDVDSSFIAAFRKPAALLPIARHRLGLLYLIETVPVTIVVSETGSGKTTQIPQYLEQDGWCSDGKMIAVTQPRRISAISVAARVAEEMRCDVGDQVGYSIRFEDLTSASTKIKFMTDGLLLREALVDPLLSRYSVIMVDEAHERSLSTDILLGVLKKILKKRQDLRIIVSSATLQAEDFVDYFSRDETDADRPSTQPRAQAIKLDGRLFPVDILYLEDPTEEYIDRAVKTVFDIHSSEPPGDILVFLTGREEIEDAIRKIAERAESIPEEVAGVLPLPMYAGLTIEQQMYIFEPAPENTRKVILSTNIAEASVTIEGIVYVVDSGFVKLRAYNPLTGVEGLTATSVSKAAATQRAGRAGRTKPGKCYRLYTEQTFDAMESTTAPEIQRSNLAPVLLQLKALGIDNVTRFDFPVAPPAELVVRALEILYSLGALNEFAKLTRPMGIRMAELSVEPMMAKVLLSASKFGCLSEMLSIAAMVSLQGAVWSPQSSDKHAAESAKRKFAAEEGDHMTLLNIYQAFVTVGKKDSKWCRNNLLNFKSMSKAVSVRNQLRRYLERFGIDVEESLTKATKKLETSATSDDIRQCLTTGFFANAARMQPDGSFKTVNGLLTLHAHPSSLMFNRKADWVIFNEVMETSKKTFIREVTKIEKSWLLDYAPDFYRVTK